MCTVICISGVVAPSLPWSSDSSSPWAQQLDQRQGQKAYGHSQREGSICIPHPAHQTKGQRKIRVPGPAINSISFFLYLVPERWPNADLLLMP